MISIEIRPCVKPSTRMFVGMFLLSIFPSFYKNDTHAQNNTNVNTNTTNTL